jgi:hypothetical protein
VADTMNSSRNQVQKMGRVADQTSMLLKKRNLGGNISYFLIKS